MFMLDTDTCSYIIKKHSRFVLEKFRNLNPSQVCISSVTQAELLYGLVCNTKKKISTLRKQEVHHFISHIGVMAWDSEAAEAYADVRTLLEKVGRPSGAMDMMIAAHALSKNAMLVTNNTRHFSHIKKLKTTNWIES